MIEYFAMAPTKGAYGIPTIVCNTQIVPSTQHQVQNIHHWNQAIVFDLNYKYGKKMLVTAEQVDEI